MSVRSEFLRLLREDEEFRYAVVGLLGLEDLRVALKAIGEAVSKLVDSQRRLEERVVGLGVKADRLEESHIRLVESVSGLAREVGRLSESVGFGLEDVARVVVPGWLFRHEGIAVDDLVRRFFVVDGVEVELNLYGEGLKGG
ncbi:MAG: hypothetical protein QXR91_00180 [Nitrososphaerales archaeon]